MAKIVTSVRLGPLRLATFITVLVALAPCVVEASPRTAVLLDFTTPAQPDAYARANGTAEEPTVTNAMIRAFASEPNITLSTYGRSQTVAPIINVPRWMRGGSATPYGGTLTQVSGEQICGQSPFPPNRLLAPATEERRRLIYPIVARAACEFNLPVGLMDALVIQESRYNPLATSPKGAFGLTQLMPGTAAQLQANRFNIIDNVRGGARYLKAQLREFGQVDLALAAYNAGPGRVRRSGAVPPIVETQNYVRAILGNWSGSDRQTAESRVVLTPIAINPFRHVIIAKYAGE